MNSFRSLILILLIMLVPADFAVAKDVKFEASIDKQRIALGDGAQLGLTFYGAQDIPAPDIGNIDGLEVRYLGPSTMITVINGGVSSSITHMYSVLSLRIGRFELGPFSFDYKGNKYISNIVFLEAVEEKALMQEKPEEALTDKLDLTDRLFLTLSVGKTRAYVNEIIPVTVRLYVNRLNMSDIQLPTFDQEGFSKAEFKEPKLYKEELSGLIYDVLEFKTNIFATRPGDYRFGPAKVKCNLVVKKRIRRTPSSIDDFFERDGFSDSFFEDFFTHVERYPLELKSQDSPLMVSPLPGAGRPKDYSGAVGDYQFIFSASPTKVKIGDPVTLNMSINGTGNFNTVLVPKLENTEGFKLYEPEVKTEAYSKTFRQALIPESDQITQTPTARFSYFDTNRKAYQTILQGPIPLDVEEGKEEAPAQVVGVPVATGPEHEELRRDIIYIKDSPGRIVKIGYRIYKNKIFLAGLAIPFLFLITLYTIHRRTERLRRDTRYARRLRALRLAKRVSVTLKRHLNINDPKIFYEALFKALQGYLADRLHMPRGGITTDIVDAALGVKGIDVEILKKVEGLFNTCDQARFARLEISELKMMDDLKELEEVIKYFERAKL